MASSVLHGLLGPQAQAPDSEETGPLDKACLTGCETELRSNSITIGLKVPSLLFLLPSSSALFQMVAGLGLRPPFPCLLPSAGLSHKAQDRHPSWSRLPEAQLSSLNALLQKP